MFANLLKDARLARERPAHRLRGRDRAERRDQAIPCTLYQTWKDDRFGRTHLAAIEAFHDRNPDLDIVLFQDAEMTEYMHTAWSGQAICDLYDRATFGPMKTDIFRYCMLAERGGYYFDIGKGCARRLTALHPAAARALISAGGNDETLFPPPAAARHLKAPHKRLIQWALAFAPGHPILTRLIADICAAAPFFEGRTFADPKSAILQLTGPGMYNQAVRAHLAECGPDGIAQCDVDLDGHGIYKLPGSDTRFRTVPHYTKAAPGPILAPR